MLRYAQDTWVNPTESFAEGGLWGSQGFPALNDSWSQPGKQAVAKLTTTIGSTTVNDFQFSWSANRINISSGGTDPSLRTKITSLVPTVFPRSGKLHPNELPEPIGWCSTYFGILSP